MDLDPRASALVAIDPESDGLGRDTKPPSASAVVASVGALAVRFRAVSG